MLGMETLLANMLGVTPEQMRETIGSAVGLLASLEQRLNNIETMVAEMHVLGYPKTAIIDANNEAKAESIL